MVGYGATRRVGSLRTLDPSMQDKARTLRYRRVAGLFEEHVALTPLTSWLPQYQHKNPGRFKQVVNLMNRLLPEQCSFTSAVVDDEYLFVHRGVKVPFSALSDGYRAYIGWVADLLYHIAMGCPSGVKLVENRGLVLVDEIDLHLHPEWQRTVLGRLSQTLPRLQFIVTTHSPIVAGTLESSNVFRMDVDDVGRSEVIRSVEPLYGLNAEQVLLSGYFGLKSTRSEGAVSDLRRLSRQVQAGNADAALALLKRLNAERGPAPKPARKASKKGRSSR